MVLAYLDMGWRQELILNPMNGCGFFGTGMAVLNIQNIQIDDEL